MSQAALHTATVFINAVRPGSVSMPEQDQVDEAY